MVQAQAPDPNTSPSINISNDETVQSYEVTCNGEWDFASSSKRVLRLWVAKFRCVALSISLDTTV